MGEIAIRARGDQRLARQDDDPRRPPCTKGREHPAAQALQHKEGRQQDNVDFPTGTEDPQRHQPSRMHGDDKRIVRRPDLDRAARAQPLGVAAGQHKFTQPLQRHDHKDERGEAHVACRSATQLAVKPGPSEVKSDRFGRPFARSRSSTNSTVGADMLP